MERQFCLHGADLLAIAERRDCYGAIYISVHEGIWHQVIAISEKAEVKVTENIDMPSSESETWKLQECITAKLEL